jgi:hypothetical protein|tara:strand:+ start:113 stop:466 length:354 start_codon:yes stop_codon:yes gene_type:complete
MLKENDVIRFHYLKQFKSEFKSGIDLKDYTDQSEEYSGKVANVRDIIKEPVSSDTVRRAKIKGRRSKILYTVELADGGIRSFYDGRMVGTQVLPSTKRGIWKTIASAFAGRKPQTVS